jgi:hypothetical protein
MSLSSDRVQRAVKAARALVTLLIGLVGFWALYKNNVVYMQLQSLSVLQFVLCCFTAAGAIAINREVDSDIARWAAKKWPPGKASALWYASDGCIFKGCRLVCRCEEEADAAAIASALEKFHRD